MEGESLINDGLAVVLFTISAYQLTHFLQAGSTGIMLMLLEFIKVIAGGFLIGGTIAYLFSKLIKQFDDYPLEIIFSMLLFYGAFFIAEIYHFSGVIAVVIAGLIFGNYGKRIGMSPTTSLNINTFWDVAALVANSLVFLMVGLEISRISLAYKWQYLLGAILIVLFSRSAAVYLSTGLFKKIPWSWKHIFNWGGLKGSLSLALAFSLPTSFPRREEILVFAFGVVLFSLIVQGLTIKPLVSTLGLINERKSILIYEKLLSRIYRYSAGKKQLLKLQEDGTISPVISQNLQQQYEQELDKLHVKLADLYEERPQLHEEQRRWAIKQALFAEHEALENLSNRGLILDKIAEEQQRQIIDIMVEDRTEKIIK